MVIRQILTKIVKYMNTNCKKMFEEVIQNKNNEEVKRKMSIDYFENGNKLLTEIIGCCITDELLEKIQERLLEAVMINQNVYDTWTEAKEFTNRNRILGVANMFRVDILNRNSDEYRFTIDMSQ